MIIEQKKIDGRKYFLIQCDYCKNVKMYPGSKCGNGTRKYCSLICINKGKKRSDVWKQEISKRFSGSNNPFFGKNHSEQSKNKMKGSHDSWNSTKNKLSKEEYDIWYKKYCESLSGKNNHFYGKHHSPQTRKHLSEVRAKLIADGTIDLKPSHYGLKGYYFSTKMNEMFRYDSLIEYLRMKMLDMDENVISWTKRHGIKIPYILNGIQKYYVPDFLINNSIIEELKGYEEQNKKMAKLTILKSYCKNNNFKCNILTYQNIDLLCDQIFGKRINVLRKEYHEENKK